MSVSRIGPCPQVLQYHQIGRYLLRFSNEQRTIAFPVFRSSSDVVLIGYRQGVKKLERTPVVSIINSVQCDTPLIPLCIWCSRYACTDICRDVRNCQSQKNLFQIYNPHMVSISEAISMFQVSAKHEQSGFTLAPFISTNPHHHELDTTIPPDVPHHSARLIISSSQ